jgi:cobyrinic acid a,c-diamide synthase
MRDEWFIRGEVPMTKSEVRAVSVEKLELSPDSVLYDIGAGTGSVSVEAAAFMPEGTVYAVEKKREAVELLEKNRKKFQAEQIRIIEGAAPEALEGLEAPTHAFLGGTSGRMAEILSLLLAKNPEVRVVVNAITLESVSKVMEWTAARGIEADIVLVSVSRAKAAGRVHMMMAQNPVYVISFGGRETGGVKAAKQAVTAEKASGSETAYPRLMLAAPKSGSGKTMMTCGLLAAWKKRKIECRAFKCGPDYIDPMFHKYVLGIDGGNLDTFFLPEEEVRNQFKDLAAGADLSVVEGVMGYYDGVGGNDTWASSYDTARALDAPVVLVLDCKGASLSLAAEIKGFLEYRKDSRIRGVILNRISPVMAERLVPEIEKLGISVFGYLPECDAAKVTSRHLGLVIPEESKALRERLELLALEMEKTVDVEGLLRLAGGAGELKDDGEAAEGGAEAVIAIEAHGTERIRIGIARDEAFCFYYQENIKLFESLGAEFVEFDPMRDEHLPKEIAGLMLGGGYPELYAERLSANGSLLREIKEAAAGGMPILAECGGFLYLHEELETKEGEVFPMAGVIAGRAFPTGKLSRFGYIGLVPYGDTQLLKEGEEIRGHEFHYWDSTACGNAMKAVKPGGKRSWDCIHADGGLLAGFPHLYYPSNPSAAERWLELCRKGT